MHADSQAGSEIDTEPLTSPSAPQRLFPAMPNFVSPAEGAHGLARQEELRGAEKSWRDAPYTVGGTARHAYSPFVSVPTPRTGEAAELLAAARRRAAVAHEAGRRALGPFDSGLDRGLFWPISTGAGHGPSDPGASFSLRADGSSDTAAPVGVRSAAGLSHVDPAPAMSSQKSSPPHSPRPAADAPSARKAGVPFDSPNRAVKPQKPTRGGPTPVRPLFRPDSTPIDPSRDALDAVPMTPPAAAAQRHSGAMPASKRGYAHQTTVQLRRALQAAGVELYVYEGATPRTFSRAELESLCHEYSVAVGSAAGAADRDP